jgi:2-methylisocitrate lyase-like PEP mutase family enzyme
MTKTSSLKGLLCSRRCVVGVGARDALDARLIELAGFDFVWASSFCISAAHCVPDASILSMTQYLDAARSMNERTQIPVLFDADTGYGGTEHVAYATRRISESGISGLCIEDKSFPKRSSLLPGAAHTLISPEEFAAKIKAAVDVRPTSGFLIMARTESLIAGLSQNEALDRGYLYQEAGADALLIHSKSSSPEEILAFAAAWRGEIPLAIVPTNYPSLTEDRVQSLGNVRFVIYGNHTVRAAVQGTQAALAEIRRARGAHTLDGLVAPLNAVFSLQGELLKN